MSRLFVCAWPDSAARDYLRQIVGDCGSGVAATPENRWHLTLAFLGDVDRDATVRALASASLPAVTAAIQPRPIRVGRDLVAAPVTGAEMLAEAIEQAVADVRTVPPEQRPFLGHVTVARKRHGRGGRGGPPDRRAASDQEPHVLAIREVALIDSTLTNDGPSYTTVATFATVSDGAR